MSTKHDGGPAFPVPMFAVGHAKYEAQRQGLTLRDYFAAKAMQGFITNLDTRRTDFIDVPQLAKSAYHIADAMLKAREA